MSPSGVQATPTPGWPPAATPCWASSSTSTASSRTPSACTFRAYQDVLRDRGMTLSAEDYEARYLGFDDVGVFTTVASDLGFAFDRGELERLIEVKGRRYTELVAAGDVVFPDAPECIERLAGDLVLGIASGALHQEIEDILQGAGLRRHFSAIVAADDVEHAKPAPDGYARAVELLSVELGRPSVARRFRGDRGLSLGHRGGRRRRAPLRRRHDDLRRRRAARSRGHRVASRRHRPPFAGRPVPSARCGRDSGVNSRTPGVDVRARPVQNGSYRDERGLRGLHPALHRGRQGPVARSGAGRPGHRPHRVPAARRVALPAGPRPDGRRGGGSHRGARRGRRPAAAHRGNQRLSVQGAGIRR